MKLHCESSPFEALPPAHWAAFRKQVQEAGRGWGIDIEIVEGPSITDAIANFWKWNRIAEDARNATPEDA